MLRERTDTAWFSCLLRYPVMKWNGAILITPETAWGTIHHAAVLIILTLYPAADNHHKHVISTGGNKVLLTASHMTCNDLLSEYEVGEECDIVLAGLGRAFTDPLNHVGVTGGTG